MGSNDSRPRSPQLVNAPGYSAYHLNNKLGVVYEAILSYTNIRQARSPGDLISFVAFDDRADVVFEQLPVGSEYLGSLLRVHPRGGTLFTQGLFHAFDMLRRHRSTRSSSGAPGHLPVFILLTDSGAHDVQPTLSFLQQHMLAEAGRQDAVKLHALGFGQGVDSNFMSSIASLGGGSFQTIVHSDDIGRCITSSFMSKLKEDDFAQCGCPAHPNSGWQAVGCAARVVCSCICCRQQGSLRVQLQARGAGCWRGGGEGGLSLSYCAAQRAT